MAKVIELQTIEAYKESLTPNGRKINELIRRGARYLDIISKASHVVNNGYKTDTEGNVYYGCSSVPLTMLYPFNNIGGNNSRLYYNDSAYQRVCTFYDKLKARMLDKVLRPLWSEYDVEILMRVLYDIRGWQVTQDDYLQAIRKFEGDLFAMSRARQLFVDILGYTNKPALLVALTSAPASRIYERLSPERYTFASCDSYYNGTFSLAYKAYLAEIEEDVYIPHYYHRDSNGESSFYRSIMHKFVPYSDNINRLIAEESIQAMDDFVQALQLQQALSYTI